MRLVLIGNKCDLISEKVVSDERGQALADEYHIPFFETSAKGDIHVEDAFASLVNKINARLFEVNGPIPDSDSLNLAKRQRQSCAC